MAVRFVLRVIIMYCLPRSPTCMHDVREETEVSSSSKDIDGNGDVRGVLRVGIGF